MYFRVERVCEKNTLHLSDMKGTILSKSLAYDVTSV